MGAWSGEPFGNAVAADWVWELEDVEDWDVVRAALASARTDAALDEETATIALAAAEVVAHGIGRATQDDAYTGEVTAFVVRAGVPAPELVAEARVAVARAAAPEGALARTWAECGDEHWRESVERLTLALRH